jgi:hypothetical protein
MQLNSTDIGHHYISTHQAASTNGTNEQFLLNTGREIGYERDYNVPGLGEFDIEVVRFRSPVGLSRAYNYFMTLPATQNLVARPYRAVGEKAAVVVTSQVAFIELKRGRYYAVLTALPVSTKSLDYLSTLSKLVDGRIVRYSQGNAT